MEAAAALDHNSAPAAHANPSPAATQQLPQMNAHAAHSQPATGTAQAPQAGSSAAPAELSAIQYQQLQQLQFQSMQWQYLQQLQQQQMWLQQQQQQGQFDPQSTASHQSAGSSQYRSAYQSYGEYPSEVHQPAGTQEQQQPQHLDADGNPIHEDPNATESSRRRYRNDNHAPSIDPADWNDSVAYASKSNPDRYMTHRTYFSHIEPVVDRLPRKPELKELVIKGRDFYTNNRDPRFYNPVQESGWDNRAHVVKYPVTHPIHGVQHSTVQDGAAVPTSRLSDPNAPQGGVRLPHVEEAKEAFGQFPVLVDNQAASTRAGSKLLIPFLHHWPPPFRFDFLKKHSRAPLSPFLASLNGYEVPQELFMSAKQRSAKARAEAAQQREQQGYGGAYPPPSNYNYDPTASGSHPRSDPQSVDPIERARARANTHTTYWRTVPPAADATTAASEESKSHGLRTSSPQKSRRPEWNFRHQLIPPQPRVGQTQPRNAMAASGRKGKTQDRLSSRQQAKHLQHQHRHQDAQMPSYMYDPSQPLPPLLLPNGQPMVMPPYFHPGQPFSMEQFMQQQMMMQQQQQQQQFQQPYDPNAYPPHGHDGHSHEASSHSHQNYPPADYAHQSHQPHDYAPVASSAVDSHTSPNEISQSPAASELPATAAPAVADSAPVDEQQTESTEM